MPHHGRSIRRITERLRECAGQGSVTADIAASLDVTMKHVNTVLRQMEAAGLIGWRAEPLGRCRNRRRWYLPEFRPAKAPAAANPPPRPSLGYARNSLDTRRQVKAKDASKQRAAGLASCAVAPVQLPCRIGERYRADMPAVSQLNPAECRAWANAAVAR